jgi:hypothetical protein
LSRSHAPLYLRALVRASHEQAARAHRLRRTAS